VFSDVASTWPAFALLGVQLAMLTVFTFFSFFNYLYGLASLRAPRIQRVEPTGRCIAVVVVAFNEEHVLEDTLGACEALSYENKLLVLADDSTDQAIAERMRAFARSRGCQRVRSHPLVQLCQDESGAFRREQIEIWESAGFVYIHRPVNEGFKGGSLRVVQQYLESHGIELMYLLDADWHPQRDALERTLGVLEAQPDVAFVQTKRVAFVEGMRPFQKYVSLVEDGCYHVDFAGRQVMGHPVLFSGCCTLFRLDAVRVVGGFCAGHLTEDLDLTNRLWLAGWRGVYDGSVVNQGEVPFTFDHYRRQQQRWASGSARAFKEYAVQILTSRRLRWVDKLSAIRQNGYFTTALLAGLSIFLGMATVAWLVAGWNSYAVETYLYWLGRIKLLFVALIYFCLLSNFVEPVVMVLAKTRMPRDLLHLPMMVWYAWSVIPTYALGNLEGLVGRGRTWFRTPKFRRAQSLPAIQTPASSRIFHFATACVVASLYWFEAFTFGWFDGFALLIVPAFVLAAAAPDG
jgi:cellulose synthase/poly-beta-1,6-N-acetylglucosamine synthase-like glycosyltransferase